MSQTVQNRPTTQPTTRPTGGSEKSTSPAGAPKPAERPDSTRLSSEAGRTGKSTTGRPPVDPEKQDAKKADQEAEIAERPDDDKLRPAERDDAERYNDLVAEADSYEPGSYDTDRGHLEVTEQDGIKTLRYQDGTDSRTITVDSETGDLTERTFSKPFRNGPAQFVESVRSYDRRGDVLGPVYENGSSNSLPIATLQGNGPSDLYSTSPTPTPTPSPQQQEDIRQQLLLAQFQAQQQYYGPPPTFGINSYLYA